MFFTDLDTINPGQAPIFFLHICISKLFSTHLYDSRTQEEIDVPPIFTRTGPIHDKKKPWSLFTITYGTYQTYNFMKLRHYKLAFQIYT